MPISTETELWEWLLFDAGLKTLVAKQLLVLLQDKNISLAELRGMTSSAWTAEGFGLYKSLLSQSPTRKYGLPAIRWNEPLYPQGLHDLDIKFKPALLFYSGNIDLLARPIITLHPGDLASQTSELFSDVVDMLLDGSLLPAVFSGSPQESILIGQMMVSDGEALIFVDQGVDRWTPSEEITEYIKAGRIIALSPMPPGTAANPVLAPVIQRIGAAAANRWVLSTNKDYLSQFDGLSRSTLHLLPDVRPHASPVSWISAAEDIEDAINWLNNSFITASGTSTEQAQLTIEEKLPPLSSESALHILEQGGKVPEVLRQRLLRTISNEASEDD